MVWQCEKQKDEKIENLYFLVTKDILWHHTHLVVPLPGIHFVFDKLSE